MKKSIFALALVFAVSVFSPLSAETITHSEKYLKELSGPRFVKDSKNVITDKQENLQWLEKIDVDSINWNSSQEWVKALGAGWRLPSREELTTLYVENAGGGGSGNMDPIFTTYGKWFWTGEKARVSQMFNPFGKKGAYCINFEVKGMQIMVSELKNSAVGYSAVLAVREIK
ncbi:MAG: DUF1566 domain-containing protein [Candidatus Riflebacteria bacterium]|nr:DUF1566 domain-containing protein [Candidatus Riflebacteria bacterium]